MTKLHMLHSTWRYVLTDMHFSCLTLTQHGRRYVWLPMWVDDNPDAQHDVEVSAWTRLNPFSLAHTIAPVEVEVHWYDAWSMSHLSMNQTSRQTQQQHLKAMRVDRGQQKQLPY